MLACRNMDTEHSRGVLRTRRRHINSNRSLLIKACHILLVSLLILAKYSCCDAAHVWQENVRPKLYVQLNQDDDVQRFHGNDSATDHFKLILRDGDSLLVGARWVTCCLLRI